jgi:hypothetical protein
VTKQASRSCGLMSTTEALVFVALVFGMVALAIWAG